MDMMIDNTWFKKREEHLITYASGGARSQIDYMLARREHKRIVIDCKVIPGEEVVSQHRLVMMELRIERTRKSKVKRIGKIKSWRLRDGAVAREFKVGVIDKQGKDVADQGVNEMWNKMKDVIVQVAVKICGRGRTGKPLGREEWWWNEDVQEAVKEKKITFKELNNKRG